MFPNQIFIEQIKAELLGGARYANRHVSPPTHNQFPLPNLSISPLPCNIWPSFRKPAVSFERKHLPAHAMPGPLPTGSNSFRS